MEKFGGEIGRKYATINRAGRKAAREGAFAEHTGWPESLKDRFNASILFDDASEQTVQDRILSRLETLEKQLGISIYLAQRDFPLHSTVLEGVLENEKEAPVPQHEERRVSLFSDIRKGTPAADVEGTLMGTDIEYKYLLIDKGNILLTSAEIPQKVLDARGTLGTEYREKGLRPLPMTNILHCSLGRISGFPKSPQDDTGRILKEYTEALLALRHEISKNPLHLKVHEIYYGNAYNFITSRE